MRERDPLRQRASVLKAMAHPSRLAILEALSGGDKCAGDLHQVVGADFSTVSRHLAVLRNAGIITDKKVGAHVYYSLAVPCVLNFMRCVDAVLSEDEAVGEPSSSCERGAEGCLC